MYLSPYGLVILIQLMVEPVYFMDLVSIQRVVEPVHFMDLILILCVVESIHFMDQCRHVETRHDISE